MAALLLAATGGLAGLGPVLLVAQPAWAATYSIEMDVKDNQPGKFEFDPNAKQININDRIIWTNKTQQRHTVTSDPGPGSFDSGEIASGGKFELRFKTKGTYTYHCEIHPEMTGTIDVVDPNEPVTTTTAPPPTTATTAPATTTTTGRPTTTSTEPPTTTTTALRPPAGVVPPPTSVAASPPPAPSTSSSVPSTTTTTTAPPTTPSSAPPAVAPEQPAPAPAPPAESSTTTAAPKPAENGDQTAAGPISDNDGKLDLATVGLVSLLVLVGVFGAWTLIRVRPGRI
jgi:plastocyanin